MNRASELSTLGNDPLWYKDAVIYELHVRAFYDDDGDGVGDFRGLTKKLDYLQELGVTALWLLPFCPSPLKDDGYDIADYRNVHPLYGTLKDFEGFLGEAHDRGLRVITELVVNHTSDQHPWFQRARRAKPGSRQREFYVWSDTATKYRDARIIFQDFEQSNWTFDSVAGAYYWHRFYSHQPDLNYDSPAVRHAIFRAMDFWFDMGVDGMRLDAVPYLFERERTDCENLPETHSLLKELRRHLDKKYKNRLLLAEANQWPEDAAAYFGQGDECHMNFHFPLMPRLFMGIQTEDRFPIIDILQQTPHIPDKAQWALFLRNHDELTLEMVTDEERDYMYRVYARDRQARINLGIRRRLAPLLGNNRRRIELMNALLLSLPGTPVLYYGDEIGMGDNVYLGDRNGVRTPMQWSADRNAGFSRATPQKLYLPVVIDPEYTFEAVNVEVQLNNPHSLLWWMKRMIGFRKQFKAFGRGNIAFLFPDNRKVLAFTRTYGAETILVVANLSRFPQHATLDLARFQGMIPVEILGHAEFPPITHRDYFLTLGGHSFYWFSLVPPHVSAVTGERDLPVIDVSERWDEVLEIKNRAGLEKCLPGYIRQRRWLGGKAKRIATAEIVDIVKLPGARGSSILLIDVTYIDAEPELYLLLVAFSPGSEAQELLLSLPHAVIARIAAKKSGSEREAGVLYDAAFDRESAAALLEVIGRKRTLAGEAGSVSGHRTRGLLFVRGNDKALPPALPVRAEHSNTSIVFPDRFILKLYRRLQEGLNPDVEVGDYLARAGSELAPPLTGYLEYRQGKGTPITLGVLHRFIPNDGDAWKFTLDHVEQFLERAASAKDDIPLPERSMLDLVHLDLPTLAHELIGAYAESARLLGIRTAELHLVLAANEANPAFCPEPYTPFYQKAFYQSMRNLTGQVLELLRRALPHLPDETRSEAEQVLAQEKSILDWFAAILGRKFASMRIRTHGDLHLGQILVTGKDFVMIDFEGEPARSLDDRRNKRSPLRDVAAMVRSFHYAALTALRARVGAHVATEQEAKTLEHWANYWHRWISARFLKAYLQTVEGAKIFSDVSQDEISVLLGTLRLEKALQEVSYELNSRPTWVHIPLTGILQLLHEVS